MHKPLPMLIPLGVRGPSWERGEHIQALYVRWGHISTICDNQSFSTNGGGDSKTSITFHSLGSLLLTPACSQLTPLTPSLLPSLQLVSSSLPLLQLTPSSLPLLQLAPLAPACSACSSLLPACPLDPQRWWGLQYILNCSLAIGSKLRARGASWSKLE